MQGWVRSFTRSLHNIPNGQTAYCELHNWLLFKNHNKDVLVEIEMLFAEHD